jgi:hypothetical protein
MPSSTSPNAQSILIINCGSSSIKFAVVAEKTHLHTDTNTPLVRRSGLAENLGTPEALLNVTYENGDKTSISIPNADHQIALTHILKTLGDEKPIAIGHRVVHGGEKFTQAVQINEEVISAIRDTIPLAPLHSALKRPYSCLLICLKLRFLIRHFIKPCRPKRSATPYPKIYIAYIVFGVMVFTAPAMLM